jgi:hypothetical protein
MNEAFVNLCQIPAAPDFLKDSDYWGGKSILSDI